MPVCPDRLGIGRHRVVREVACNHRAQPSALFGDAVAASVAQLRLYFLQVCTHAVASRVAPKQECSAPRAPTDKREPEEVKRLRLALPGSLPPLDRIATELQQTGLLPVQLRARTARTAPRIASQNRRASASMLEAHDQIIGIPHDDHVATGLALVAIASPTGRRRSAGRRWPAAARSPPLGLSPASLAPPAPLFQHAGLEPLAHQPDDALVPHSVPRRSAPAIPGRLRRRSPDVGVENPVHPLAP